MRWIVRREAECQILAMVWSLEIAPSLPLPPILLRVIHALQRQAGPATKTTSLHASENTVYYCLSKYLLWCKLGVLITRLAIEYNLVIPRAWHRFVCTEYWSTPYRPASLDGVARVPIEPAMNRER